MVEILLEERNTQPVHYFCLGTNTSRYDFTVIHSGQFYNKSMVISIQTGRMVLLSQEDIVDEDSWKEQLGIRNEDVEECQQFFHQVLSKIDFVDQY
ncbi:SAV0927 family protein [Bacillus sp. FJAT-27245]|uniref:SAV0927 family protein n=1 Tax=Bacillus sp. FJAT-27245 TaxID=1684144 RepID=UPI0006A7DAC0|nr:SAV0927 family protein [Bacillus sp. FJAT-27245]